MEQQLKELCKRVMALDHFGVQADNIHYCEEMHQTLRVIDSMDRYEAVRLLMHIIHTRELQLLGAEIKLDEDNPFKDMLEFNHIGTYVKCFSHTQETLYY
jgi:hypothetical protein